MIKQDPSWALPYAEGCACIRRSAVLTGSPAFDAYSNQFDDWYRHGRANAAGEPEAELSLAWVDFIDGHAVDGLMLKVERLLQRFPYHTLALRLGGAACIYAGEARRAVDFSSKLLTVCADPLEVAIANVTLGNAYIQLGRDQEAVRALREALELEPGSVAATRILLSAYGHLAMWEEATRLLARLADLAPGMTISHVRNILPFADTPSTRRYFEGLRLAGLPESDT